jgi:hypothetical protein
MVHQGKDPKVVSNYQPDGFCLGCQAIDIVHKKTLLYDLTQILWIILATCDNDATGCYERIIVAT